MLRGPVRAAVCALGVLVHGSTGAVAAERVTLVNGFSLVCDRHEVRGDQTRLFLSGAGATGEAGYMDVAAAAVAAVAELPQASPSGAPTMPAALSQSSSRTIGGEASRSLTAAEMHPLLARAGEAHRIDEDLLASVVRAESGGRSRAVSRVGARGLMQLMPGTAASLGVSDAFEPAQNVDGGAAYLDQLLLRYRNNIALALAAYNAGPGAVDRWHGVPPYRETRAYVSRVIREFNRRKLAVLAAASADGSE